MPSPEELARHNIDALLRKSRAAFWSCKKIMAIILKPENVAQLACHAVNQTCFPEDFMFRLSRKEAETVRTSRSQNVTLKRGQNIKYLPYVFTEYGALMAANILSSPRAVQMSIFVVRAFAKMREALRRTPQLA